MNRANSGKTGLQIVLEWADAFKTRAEAAEKIINEHGETLAPGHFIVWLNVVDRGIRPPWAQAIALAVGLPIEAILFKNTPLKDLPCEKARKRSAA